MSKKRKRLTASLSTNKKSTTPRNTVALNPLLKKSSAHGKNRKAERVANKVQLKKTWFERVAVIAAPGQNHVFCTALCA